MPSPFPGMDPYLEHPEIWPGVHLLLISALAESLTPVLRPNYAISVEVRLYETFGDHPLLVGIPDASVQRARGQSTVAVATQPDKPVSVTLPISETIRQGYLEVREVTTKEVVAVIEILSPVNKRPGRGRDAYLGKRDRILTTATHLVEIDLLRAWEPMPMFANGLSSHHYQVLVSRSRQRPNADLYAFNLSDPIPVVPLPLDAEQPEPAIDLKTVLHQVYDRNAYDLKLDYDAEPVPALTETEAAWADTLLKKQHLR